jgi:hypothetical protein
MGIHQFHKWLKETCPTDITNIDKMEIDHLYIDMNFCLHNCAYGTKNSDILIKKLKTNIQNILEKITPKKSITFSSDGSASYAKILLQRQRRLTASFNTDAIDSKVFSTLWFTPGTEFMKNLSSILKDFFNELITKHMIIINNLLTSRDEAEVKIVKQILDHNQEDPNSTHMVFSNDADVVVMLNSISCYKNTYICMKEKKTFKKINIGGITNTLNKSLNIKLTNNNIDYSVLFLLMGNDYIPKLGFTKIEKLLAAYKMTIKQIKTGLIVNNKIDNRFMCGLMYNLSCYYMSNSVLNRIDASSFDKDIHESYFEGLSWCTDIYKTGTCFKYDYMYKFGNRSPHPMGLALYLKKHYNPMTIIKYGLKNPMSDDFCAILILPQKAKDLINKKYHTVLSKLNFLYEIELCKTCSTKHHEISNLNQSIQYMTATEKDTDELKQKSRQMSESLLDHKRKNHKIFNVDDIEKMLLILEKEKISTNTI